MDYNERAILHIDMDAFYASVEVLDNPGLRGRPVIIAGTPSQRGVVSAASYEAREFGIHSAMSSARAHKLCPDGVFLPVRMKRYIEISRRIKRIFQDYTPLVEPISIDEAFLDVTGCRRLFGPPEQIGRQIKQRIHDEVGLTASVGLAGNKFLAKLASDLEKPDGFVVVPVVGVDEFLAPLPVSRIWGVGKVTEKALIAGGIRTIRQLQAIPKVELIKKYGDHAAQLHELAFGRDERPVVPSHKAKSYSHETTFSRDISSAAALQQTLDQLAAKVAQRLRKHGVLARTVSLKARYADFSTVTRSVTLPKPTAAGTVIRDTARYLLKKKLGRRGRALRLIGVAAANLCDPEEQPRQLFPELDADQGQEIDKVLDQVNLKFGDLLSRGAGKRHRDS